MSKLLLLRLIVLGFALVISIRAFNAVFYYDFSILMWLQILIAPSLGFVVLPRQHWMRAFAGLCAIAGVFGLALIISEVARSGFMGVPYREDVLPVVVHASVSIVCLLVYSAWAWQSKRADRSQ